MVLVEVEEGVQVGVVVDVSLKNGFGIEVGVSGKRVKNPATRERCLPLFSYMKIL